MIMGVALVVGWQQQIIATGRGYYQKGEHARRELHKIIHELVVQQESQQYTV